MNIMMDDDTLKKLHEVMIEILDEFVRICDKNKLQYFLIGGTLLGAVRHKGFIPWDDDLDVAMPREDYEKFIDIANQELDESYEIDNFKNNKEYYLNFTKLRKKNTLFVQNFQNNYNGPKGIWIDIFPLDNWKCEKSFLGDIKVKFIKMLRSIAHYRTGIFIGSTNNFIKIIKKIIGFISKPIKTNKIMILADKLMKKDLKKNTDYFINISSQYNFHKQTIKKEKFFPSVKLDFCGKKYECPNDYDYILKRIYGDYMQLPPVEERVTHNPKILVFDKEKYENE